MTSKTQNAAPFSRFSRMGFNLFKAQPTSPRRRDPEKMADDDESWYIPYNGPYETAPQRQVRHEKDRDSWGDPVNGEDEDILGDPELHNRYGGHDYRPQEVRATEGKGRVRARTQSSASGRTTSSGAIDPSRNSTGATRRSTVSHGTRPIVPSFVDLDSAGGVGESPMPMSRYSKDNNSSRRKSSFTSLFTFNSGKKTNPSTKGLMSVPNTPLRSSGLADAQGHHNYSGQSAVQPPSIRRLSSDPTAANQSLRHSGQVQQEYYNSYYSSLISIPPERSSDLPGDGQQPSQLHSPASETSSALHPYAYRVSTPPSLEPPRSAPLYPSASARAGPSGLASPPVPMQQSPHITLHPPANISLKNSVSTPNLRAGRRSKPSFPKGKDKWLSPETWCDALLFPRPRFKIKQDSDSFSAGSGRIVSPPGSPVIDQFHNGQDMPSVASRVLQHSRSLFELRSPPPVAGPSALSPPKDRLHAQPENTTPVTDQNRSTESRPSRPKSWALDDLALPSPAPSLARVLEEGQILEHQRKKWQDQAIKSFQNERARSLSRARTKSLTSKQVKRSEAHSRLDFLAARGLLGNQDMIPVVPSKTRSRANSNTQTDSRGTVGRSSHTHSNSLSKSVSKSSKSHSRSHSRSESLGKSAVKMAKSTAKSTVHLLGCDGANVLTPVEGPPMGLDGALRGNGTRIIRLADPALLPIESATTSRNGSSPTPSGNSGISDSKVGIAISTPPPQAEEIRLHSHPYAQGGLSFYSRSDNAPVDQPRNDYAGPHPSSSKLAVPEPRNLVSRHRSPPQTISHPYAQFGSARDRDSFQSLVAHARPDSNVPAGEKMWAQWSPGHVREILPNELQYSPFISASNSPAPGVEAAPVHRQMRNSSPIFDTIGVAETLVSAMQRYSRDSGLGTSEEQTIPTESEPKNVMVNPSESETLSSNNSHRPHRIPVQYDASRPLYIQKHNPAPPRSPSPIFESPERLRTLRNDSNDSSNSSNSPPLVSPLGNVDDLENYRDLFYRPAVTRNDSNVSTTARVPWDVNSSGHRGSGLTSIVRQLSEELEETRGVPSLHRSISLSSRSSLSALRQSAYSSGRSPPTESGLHFVFSNIPETASQTTSVRKVTGDGTFMAFKPSIQIPEDIASSRASSPTRSPLDNDELDLFRLGHVHSLATPPAVSSENRVSYTGQMDFAGEEEDTYVRPIQTEAQPSSPSAGRRTATSHSSLQPPPLSSDPTRSSYLTSSDASRMSNLSDFPAPPPQQLTPAHMSLLSSYFDETLTASELTEVKVTGQLRPAARSRSGSVQTSRPPIEPRNTPRPEARTPADIPNTDGQSRRLTFGGDEEIEDLLASLSSHS